MDIDHNDQPAFEPENKKIPFRKRQTKARLSGEPYVTQKKKLVPGRLPPTDKVSFIFKAIYDTFCP